MSLVRAAIAALALLCSAPAFADPIGVFDVDAAVAFALAQSARIDEAEAKVAHWRAKLAEVESIYYPKLQAQALLAPIFTIEGSALDADVKKRFRSIRDWGPYTQLELTLIQPLYTFGRANAGADAAEARMAVEAARVRRVENSVALEVRKLYYTHLFVISMHPTLDWASERINGALAEAREWHSAGNGKVSTVDIAKLEFAEAQLAQLRSKTRNSADLTLSALKFAMGLPEDSTILLADERLPRPATDQAPGLDEMLYKAAVARPEWDEIKYGRKAALRLSDAELLANAPTLFIAGQVTHNWAPTVDNQSNPFHKDPYNGASGGIALGIRFDADPRKSITKSRQAEAQVAEIEALSRFARSGIPLEVRRAHADYLAAVENFGHAERGRRAARKWAFFASSAFLTGAGGAKDIIDGIAAYLESTRTYYDSLLQIYITQARLEFAAGLPQPGSPLR